VRLDFDHDDKDEKGGKGKDDQKDSITFVTDEAIPAGFDPSGRQVSIDFGGVVRSFTLGPNGQSGGPDSCRLDVKKTGGSVAAQRAALVINIRGSDVESALADEGLTDRDATGARVTVLVKLVFDGRTENRLLELTYDAQAGRKGTAK
jgi:hypothetical protein